MPNLTCNRRPLTCGLVVLAVLIAGVAMAQTGAEGTASVPDAQVAPEVQLAFGLDVDRTTRSLVGENTAFVAADFSAESGQIYCLTRLSGMTPPTTITHVWYHEGKTMARVELNVGGASWRTWSSKRILPAWTGQWEVKVLDADGMVLGSAGFTIN